MPDDSSPAPPPSESGLGDLFRSQADEAAREAGEFLERSLALTLDTLQREPEDASARCRAAFLLRRLCRNEEALELLRSAARTSRPVLHRYVALLAEFNQTEAAIAAAHEGLVAAFPGDILLRLHEALLLPVLYDSPSELPRCRARFAEGLERLPGEIPLSSAPERLAALEGLAGHTNMYLAYQGENDRDLQARYGVLVDRIMSSAFPDRATRPPMPPREPGAPMRVGYVSSRFQDRSATRFFLGWLRGHDRARVSVSTWHVRPGADRMTDEVKGLSAAFHHIARGSDPDPGNRQLIGRIAASIANSRLHALVFLDIGIDPLMTQLAALRLAPIQCMAWDHPVTSGLPAVEFALSGALAEPPEAASHYAEKLVLLPGIGVSYRRPVIPTPLLRKTRRDFSLRPDAVVYLCCQSAFKFLPGNDHVYAEIARRMPESQFVFIVPNGPVQAFFSRRLERSFAAAGLRAGDYCVFLPQLSHLDYWNLNRVGDVFLDTLGWSSAGSLFDAIACGKPVVTLPGRLMRSRQGLAILEQLGVTDTIARDKADFVSLAVQLGGDLLLRQQIAARMRGRETALYSDSRSVAALEDFLESQVASAGREGVHAVTP